MHPRPIFNDRMSVEIPLQDFLEHYAPVSDFLQSLLAPDRYFTDFTLVRSFLAKYTDEQSTFLSYRQSAERLLLWSWLVANKSILDLSALEINDFIAFNKMPPDNWQTAYPRKRFVNGEDGISFNENWRPFNNARSLSMSNSSIVQLLRICSSLYNYLLATGNAFVNPVAVLNSVHSKREKPFRAPRPALAFDLWQFASQLAVELADEDQRHERALFIVMCAYHLRVRISDLGGSNRQAPLMTSFFKRRDVWWFKLDSCVHEIIPIRVPLGLLPYLKRYRLSRGLPPFPSDKEDVPLLETSYGRPGLSARQVRELVNVFFALIADKMEASGVTKERCLQLRTAPFAILKGAGARDAALAEDQAWSRSDFRPLRSGASTE